MLHAPLFILIFFFAQAGVVGESSEQRMEISLSVEAKVIYKNGFFEANFPAIFLLEENTLIAEPL